MASTKLYDSIIRLLETPIENKEAPIVDVDIEIISHDPFLVKETGTFYSFNFPDLQRQISEKIKRKNKREEIRIRVKRGVIKFLKIPYKPGKWYLDFTLESFEELGAKEEDNNQVKKEENPSLIEEETKINDRQTYGNSKEYPSCSEASEEDSETDKETDSMESKENNRKDLNKRTERVNSPNELSPKKNERDEWSNGLRSSETLERESMCLEEEKEVQGASHPGSKGKKMKEELKQVFRPVLRRNMDILDAYSTGPSSKAHMKQLEEKRRVQKKPDASLRETQKNRKKTHLNDEIKEKIKERNKAKRKETGRNSETIKGDVHLGPRVVYELSSDSDGEAKRQRN